MKVNKDILKFARDSRFIEKIFKETFEAFDISKLEKIEHGYQYKNIKIIYWHGSLYEDGIHYEIFIDGEMVDDEMVVGFLKSITRKELFEKFYNEFDRRYQKVEKAWEENKDRIKEEFLCEIYKKSKENE